MKGSVVPCEPQVMIYGLKKMELDKGKQQKKIIMLKRPR